MKRSVPAVPVIQKCRGVRACMILAIPLSLLLGTFGPATATDGLLFAPPLSFATGNNPVAVAIGDLNGDGKPDLAVANAGYPSYNVSVLLGNGDGTLGPKTDYGTFAGPYSLAIGDLNGDGRPDLVVGEFYNFGVSVLLGNGDGSFGVTTAFHTGSGVQSVAIGDLNGDGKPDLATANDYDNAVSVLLGNGDGSFGGGTEFGTGSAAWSVAIGDLNGDGKPDLAVANAGSATVSVLLGNGDGRFGVKTDHDTGISPRSVAIGDLNGDGRPDLVVATSGSNTVSVLLGNGDGSFAPKTDYGTVGSSFSVAIGDLNGDAKPDLAVANSFSNTVAVLLGNGDGSFAPTDYVTGFGPWSVAIGDLNGDGKPDLATADFNSNTASVLLNIGPSGCPSTPMSFDLTPNTLNLRSMGRWVTATLEPEPPDSPANIDVASIRLNGSVAVDPSGPISIGDVDGDGRPDLSVKFNRAALGLAVAEGEAVPVTVSGKIGSGCFEATDRIRVFRPHVTAPSAGSVLPGGGTTEVRWYTPADVQVQSVALLWSNDDGASWTLAARELPNSGSYLWRVPSASTEQARVAVVVAGPANARGRSGPEDQSGLEVSGVLGVSERFVIATPLGVGEPRLELALQGSVPNPSRNLSVSFTLPGAGSATLVAYDVSGREVSRREAGSLGAGRHVVTLGAPGRLAPGIYLVNLIQGERRLVTRAVVIR